MRARMKARSLGPAFDLGRAAGTVFTAVLCDRRGTRRHGGDKALGNGGAQVDLAANGAGQRSRYIIQRPAHQLKLGFQLVDRFSQVAGIPFNTC